MSTPDTVTLYADAIRSLTQGGYVIEPRRGFYYVAKPDGSAYYVTPTLGECDCKAGEFGQPCKHLRAVLGLECLLGRVGGSGVRSGAGVGGAGGCEWRRWPRLSSVFPCHSKFLQKSSIPITSLIFHIGMTIQGNK